MISAFSVENAFSISMEEFLASQASCFRSIAIEGDKPSTHKFLAG